MMMLAQSGAAETVSAHGLTIAWGTVPEGIGVILTSLSIFIAALAYRRSVLDKEREQASKINAWVEFGSHRDGVGVVVRNDSSLPIRNFFVQWTKDEDPKMIWGAILEPGSEKFVRSSKHLALDTPISWTFVDAAGRYWGRDSGGKLRKLRKRPSYADEMDSLMRETR